MDSTPSRLLRGLFSMFTALLWASSPEDVRGQPPELKSPTLEQLSKAKFDGVAACMRCHTVPTGGDRPEFVKLTEYTTWTLQDKHSLAYAVLEGPRGQRMQRLLGGRKVTDPATGCLNCHSMNFPADRVNTDRFSVTDGVSCDGCHGPSQYWYRDHSAEKGLWRKLSPDQKEAFGMYNLRNPIKRAEMCMSCHVGSPGEGKVITHEMYAAGHPPLPAFELASFTDNLPPHWYKRHEIPILKGADPELRAKYYADMADEEPAQLVTAGSISALRRTMVLLATRADFDGQWWTKHLGQSTRLWPPPWIARAYDPETSLKIWPELVSEAQKPSVEMLRARWPEFFMANADCYACHHDLRSESWRQKRGYLGMPGRPQTQDWPFTLFSLSPGVRARQAELVQRQSGLTKAFDARPFGEAAEVIAAAEALISWSMQFDKAITTENTSLRQQWLQQLCDIPEKQYPSFDSARQVAFAFRALSQSSGPALANGREIEQILKELEADLHLGAYTGSRKERAAEIKAIAMKLLRNPQPNISDEEFGRALLFDNVDHKELRKALSGEPFLKKMQEISDRELGAMLACLNRYKPEDFKAKMKKLASLLGKPAGAAGAVP